MSSSLTLLVTILINVLTLITCNYVQPQPQVYGPQVRYSPPFARPQPRFVQPQYQVSHPQQYTRQIAPQYVPQHPSPSVYSHRRLIDPATNAVVYHHSYAYNNNNNSHHEVRSWTQPESRPMQPYVERAMSRSIEVPFDQQYPRPQPLVEQPPNNQQRSNQRSLERSSESSNPVILNQAEPTWTNNIETIVSFIKSPKFLAHIGTIGSQSAFKSHIIDDKMGEDEERIKKMSEKTGINFSINNDDCKPRMTVVKLGRIDMPEIMFNPSSIEILRCPQACFSWQFDCVPTERKPMNITVSTYLTKGDKITRKIDTITIDSHESCACSCQSFASCFGSSKMSPKRLPPSP